jgi:hypothetical protein
MINHSEIDASVFGFSCRECMRFCSYFKLSFKNPRRGLCDDCEDNEPIPTEDE